jgi:hypothetical protein
VTDEPVFYHGTRRGFTRGGAVFPRQWHGGAGTSAPINPGQTSLVDAEGYVYLTNDLDLAWAYAWCAPGRGRPKVLILDPMSTPEPDPEHSTRMAAYRCSWARVSKVLTTPTITETEARGGWQTQPDSGAMTPVKEEARS